MSKVKGRITVTAILALAFSAGSFIASGTAAEKTRIVFATTPTTLFLPYYVAQKKGWLGDLNIEEIYVTGDANAARAVISGNADFGAGIGTFSVLSAVGAGSDLKAVGAWSPLPDYNVVIAAGKGDKISDLAGKVIATAGPGSLPEQLPRMLMKKYNIDASTTRFVQVGGHASRLQAVLGGKADAALINKITSLDAIQSGRVNLVARIPDEFPTLGYVWNVVRGSTLNDPKISGAIQILTTAGIRGCRFVMENPDEAASILHDRVTEIDLDLAKRVVRELNKDKVWGVDGGLDPKIAEYTAKTGIELGILTQPVAASALLDRQFVDVALKELGPAN
jgi:NitT/TauT family transport system substrate-binding protein